MDLTPQEQAKVDSLLREILTDTDENEDLQVIMILGEDQLNTSITDDIQPSQFSSRVEYRQALIERKKQQLAGTVGQTVRALQDLSLDIRGGETSRFLVVKGTTAQICQSLNLPGVKSISLDQIIRVPSPAIDPRWVQFFSQLILEILPDLSQHRDQLQQASQEYISKYYQLYGQFKVLAMRQPLKLKDVYTNVKVLPKELVKDFKNIDGLVNIFKYKKGSQSRDNENKKNGLTVADEYQYLTVLGAPGVGKSTLLRKVGLEAIKGSLNVKSIPCFIELKTLNNPQSIDLLAVIAQTWAECQFPFYQRLVEQGLKQGKFLILLDGLDEVPQQSTDSVVSKIQEFIKKYNKNRFIISCRTAAYKEYFPEFENVIIADFDEEQIQQFIHNWFSSDSDKRTETADKCLAQLAKHPGAKELAKTPLLLTLICLVFDNSQTLPKNISNLYKEALQIFLEKWSTEKRLDRDPIYQDFTTNLELMLLAEISYQGVAQDQLFYQTSELIDKIEDFLQKNLHAPQSLNGEAVLNAIAIQQGILVERLDNIYSFSHLTLQEYLTAKYIVDNNLIEETVKNYATKTRWKEAFILIAGLMTSKTGADTLLLALENKALSYLRSLPHDDCFRKLLQWAEQSTENSAADLTPVAKRVVAILFAYANAYAKANAIANAKANANANAKANANAYAIAIAYAYAIANAYANAKANANAYANAYAYAYAKAYAKQFFINSIEQLESMPSLFSGINFTELKEKFAAINPETINQRKDKKQAARELIETWLTAFGLNLEMIDLSSDKLKEIDREYFYIYHLILKCKEAADLVTTQTWQNIEERMYRKPTES